MIVGSVFFWLSAEATLDVAATRAEIQSLRTEVERLRRLQDTDPVFEVRKSAGPTCLEIKHFKPIFKTISPFLAFFGLKLGFASGTNCEVRGNMH